MNIINPIAESQRCSFVTSAALTVTHDDYSNSNRNISGCTVAANRCHCERSFRLCSKWLVIPSCRSHSPHFFDAMTHWLLASSLVFHKKAHQEHNVATNGLVSTIKLQRGHPTVLYSKDKTRQLHHLGQYLSYCNVSLYCWKQNKRNR